MQLETKKQGFFLVFFDLIFQRHLKKAFFAKNFDFLKVLLTAQVANAINVWMKKKNLDTDAQVSKKFCSITNKVVKRNLTKKGQNRLFLRFLFHSLIVKSFLSSKTVMSNFSKSFFAHD